MSKLTPPVGPGDHLRGPAGAPVTLVEYGDYECPHCGRAHEVVEEVMRRMDGSVRFAYRHFPLSEIHPHALLAAEAAEAVGPAKFWAMHDTLFQNQDALEIGDLIADAETVGVDTPRFVRDLEIQAPLPKVKADFRSGVLSGVNGTPTFFIDGARFDGPWDADSLTAALRRALLARA